MIVYALPLSCRHHNVVYNTVSLLVDIGHHNVAYNTVSLLVDMQTS